MATPAVILVGADNGGVGKTTVSRTLLDYFTAHHVRTRTFDAEAPLPSTMVVPVHNEAVSVYFEREDFPPSRPECRMVRIPRLSPIVRGVIDRPSFSFGNHLTDQRGGRTEIHDWIDGIFAEFREFELRLLMGRLSSVLAGTLSKGPRPRRKPSA